MAQGLSVYCSCGGLWFSSQHQPTWQLTVCNPSPRASNALFCPLRAPHTPSALHTYRQNIYKVKIDTSFKNTFALFSFSMRDLNILREFCFISV